MCIRDRYKHGSGQPVLNDVTFSIRPGETLGIIGGTGRDVYKRQMLL